MKIPRVVLDTNVIVSGVAYPSGTPGRLLELWRTGALLVTMSPYILQEVVRVLPRVAPFDPIHVPRIVEALAELAEIVTGDKDLLALAHTYPVVTPAAFWAGYAAG